MKKYAYEQVTIKNSIQPMAEHRHIIDRYANDGWEYVGFIPLDIPHGMGVQTLDLVFSKNVTKLMAH